MTRNDLFLTVKRWMSDVPSRRESEFYFLTDQVKKDRKDVTKDSVSFPNNIFAPVSSTQIISFKFFSFIQILSFPSNSFLSFKFFESFNSFNFFGLFLEDKYFRWDGNVLIYITINIQQPSLFFLETQFSRSRVECPWVTVTFQQ